MIFQHLLGSKGRLKGSDGGGCCCCRVYRAVGICGDAFFSNASNVPSFFWSFGVGNL